MIRSIATASIALALSAVSAGCGFNESPHKCKKFVDCPNGRLCVFSLSDGCTGMGHCEDIPACRPVSSAAFQGCGCDGMPVFDLTSTDQSGLPQQRIRENVCGWDGPIKATTACK